MRCEAHPSVPNGDKGKGKGKAAAAAADSFSFPPSPPPAAPLYVVPRYLLRVASDEHLATHRFVDAAVREQLHTEVAVLGGGGAVGESAGSSASSAAAASASASAPKRARSAAHVTAHVAALSDF